MKVIGEEMRKYEYILDVFKGTCELNNFEGIKAPAFDEDGCPCDDVICEVLAIKPETCKKVYFYGPQMNEEETTLLGAIADKISPYSGVEMINMAVKFLFNLDVTEVMVSIGGEDAKFVKENLEALDIPVEVVKDKDAIFKVLVDDKEIAFGGMIADDGVFMEMDYKNIADVVDYKNKALPLDVYVAPLAKEVLDDGFIIGSNLKDAGLKVEIDYSLKQVTKDDVDATFLVTFDKDDIANYQVKLVDMATKEIKTVGIDNLVEELAFI